MFTDFFQLLFLFFFPALAERLSRKFSKTELLSPIVLCYATGILLANQNLITINRPLNEWVMNLSVPIAMALLLLSSEVKSWLRNSKQLMISFALALIAVLFSLLLCSFLFIELPHINEVAAMLAGVYSGSTPNLLAVGYALESAPDLIALTNTADLISCTVYLFALLSFLPALLRFFLPAYKISEHHTEPVSTSDSSPVYHKWNIYTKFRSHMISILIAFLVFGGVALFSLLLWKEIKPAVVVVGVSSLAILASFIPTIRKQKAAYFSGQYLLMVFCTSMGMNANFSLLWNQAGPVLAFASCALCTTLVFHFVLSRLFKIDADTTLVTSTATIFGPPFIGQICGRLKNQNLIVPGMIMGVMGILIGNYFGLMTNWIIRHLIL